MQWHTAGPVAMLKTHLKTWLRHTAISRMVTVPDCSLHGNLAFLFHSFSAGMPDHLMWLLQFERGDDEVQQKLLSQFGLDLSV